MNMNLNKTFR